MLRDSEARLKSKDLSVPDCPLPYEIFILLLLIIHATGFPLLAPAWKVRAPRLGCGNRNAEADPVFHSKNV